MTKRYTLLGADGVAYESDTPGTLGGHRKGRGYGRLDCPSALRAIARGGPYPRHRVFFADEATAIAAGYRPCHSCLPGRYAEWKRGDWPPPEVQGREGPDRDPGAPNLRTGRTRAG